MRVVIAAGHTHNTDDDFRAKEHAICGVVANEIRDFLPASIEPIPLPLHLYSLENNDSLNKRVSWLNSILEPIHLAVELHLNGGGGSYSTALHHPNSKYGRMAAVQLGKAYAAAFPWDGHLGQPETRYGRSGLAWLNHTRMPAVICEPGFLDNSTQDWEKAEVQRLYSLATAMGIIRHFQEFEEEI